MTEKQIIKFIPSESTLIENKRKQCTVPGCTSTFTNLSNLQMHLNKHHRIPINKIVDNKTEVHYFCPVNKCKYNVLENASSSYFKTKKYLRQHFLKVHAVKSVKCSKCTKAFANKTLKVQHERNCGIIFQCLDCDWKYTSRECLLTHCRRKGHTVPPKRPKEEKPTQNEVKDVVKPNNAYAPIVPKKDTANVTDNTNALIKKVQYVLESTPAARIKANFDRAMQKSRTAIESKPLQSTASATCSIALPSKSRSNDKYKSLELIDEESNSSTENSNEATRNLNNLSYVEDDSSLHYFTVSNFNAGLCHIETQTDLMPLDDENISTSDMDPLLCHMHTQTSDDILTELGLANIQTQTNWTSDDLFVSTETQTCFDVQLDMGNTSTQTQNFSNSNLSRDNSTSQIATQTYFE